MFTKVIIDLENWSEACPTGAVAFGDETESEYCDTLEEFDEFFEEIADRIDEYTELVVKCKVSEIKLLTDFIEEIRNRFEERRA